MSPSGVDVKEDRYILALFWQFSDKSTCQVSVRQDSFKTKQLNWNGNITRSHAKCPTELTNALMIEPSFFVEFSDDVCEDTLFIRFFFAIISYVTEICFHKLNVLRLNLDCRCDMLVACQE